MTQEDLNAIGALMDKKLQPIIERLDTLEERQEETRNGVNALLEWSEKISMAVKFPLPAVDD